MPAHSELNTVSIAMHIYVEVPSTLPDALQCTPEVFAQEAKMAMAVKLFEMKRLSSGMAAALAGVNRVAFIAQLHRYGVPVIDLSLEELESDVANA
ncbi:MAG: UPF0175 family protein [Chromatiaceae bacterium]